MVTLIGEKDLAAGLSIKEKGVTESIHQLVLLLAQGSSFDGLEGGLHFFVEQVGSLFFA